MNELITFFTEQTWTFYAGCALLIGAWINNKHSEEQLDQAFNMAANSDTDRICRQIRMLETRIWSQSWWVIAGIGILVLAQ